VCHTLCALQARFYDEPGSSSSSPEESDDEDHPTPQHHHGSTYPMHVHWKMWYSPSVWSDRPNVSDVQGMDTVTTLWPGQLNETLGFCEDKPPLDPHADESQSEHTVHENLPPWSA
jgi:hypothetical protein